jgi:hypothetical protein
MHSYQAVHLSFPFTNMSLKQRINLIEYHHQMNERTIKSMSNVEPAKQKRAKELCHFERILYHIKISAENPLMRK